MIKRLLSILIAVAACCMPTWGQESVEAFVTSLLGQYPEARLLDIYKSCFQDYMGAEHLVSDTTSARTYLDQELATTTAEELMPWYSEPCGVEGRYVRVSLKAVHEGLVGADALLAAFVSSANAERPTVESWRELWHRIVTIIDHMELNLANYREDRQFIEQVLAQGKYAISHSPNYRAAYKPHYRIVGRDIFEREIKPLLPTLPTCCEGH